MAQPINMAQVPPMANPPIKEQPVYQPFTPPTAQPPNSNGSFSTGMVWAILVLILCCNPIAIASIVLSAIAGAEFKRGDIANAQKHASLSKKITIAAAIITIIFGTIFNNLADDTTQDDDDDLQEEVENDSVDEEMLEEAVEKIQERIKQNQSNNGVKIDIKPASNNSDQPIDVERIKAIRKEKVEKQKKLLQDLGMTHMIYMIKDEDRTYPDENGPLLDEATRKKIKEELEKRIREREKLQDLKPSPNK